MATMLWVPVVANVYFVTETESIFKKFSIYPKVGETICELNHMCILNENCINNKFILTLITQYLCYF